jgi:soluble cytochrome b562
MASLIVSDQSGNLSEVPEEEFHGATGLSSYGYSVANPQQIQEFKEQQEYNAPLKQAESLGVGALSGATAGLSNVALDYSGIVPKEEQEKLSKYNPTESNIVGPALGIGGSLLIPGGGAVGAISKLGRAGEEAVSQVIPRGTSLASKIISSAASKGVGSAIEAAAYTGGNVASESMLGDPKLTAEAIAQEFGLSLAIGGGLGGILGTAEHLLPASLNLAKSSMGKLRDFAFGTGEGAEGGAGVLGNAFADVAAPVSGIAPETITAKIASRMAGLEQTEKDAIVNEFSDEMQKTVNSLNSTVKTFNSEIKPQEKVNLLNNMDDYQKGVVANQLDTISQHAKNVISQMRDNP